VFWQHPFSIVLCIVSTLNWKMSSDGLAAFK
jgi:hypothetical protein